jgi:hypothetical protein
MACGRRGPCSEKTARRTAGGVREIIAATSVGRAPRSEKWSCPAIAVDHGRPVVAATRASMPDDPRIAASIAEM